MKLIRIGDPGAERPGIVDTDGQWRDCSAMGEDWNESFFGTGGVNRLRDWLADNEGDCPVVDSGERLGPPICRPSKLVCVGLNYVTHAREAGMDVPEEPVLFMKATSSISGPFDAIVLPSIQGPDGTVRTSEHTDWEVELAVVIGAECLRVSRQEAIDYVAGYAVHNDVSERATQLHRGGQWVKGKSYDTFAPLGPWLVTPDEIENPDNLSLWLSVNQQRVQSDTTRSMIFPVAELISYISWHMRLLPGDVISTGTPFGVGMGLSPARYLQAGDEVELGVEGLGVARQIVVETPDPV